MKKANSLAVRAPSFDRRAMQRALLLAATIACFALSLWLTLAVQRAQSTSGVISTAKPSMAVSTSAVTIESFASTWGAQRAKTADQITLTWSVRDARDLRASLLAFDATQPKSPRITVSKRDNGFAIAVEATP
ncbi:MAG: hypothetical protein ACRDAM_19550 [Casimicrobium sp.]